MVETSASDLGRSPVGETPSRPSLREQNRLNRRAAWRWGGLVVAFLAGQIAVGVVAVVLATGDPSFAVVPDYHEKAMRWDDAVRAQAASDQLGWRADIIASASPDLQGNRTLVVTLRDRHGEAVDDAVVRVRAFHHARAGEPVAGECRPHGGGGYSCVLPMNRLGLWQVELVATRDADERFLLSETLEMRAGAS